MKRLVLLFGSLLCGYGWGYSQVTTQAFTGSVIANSVVTPTGFATAAPGDRISGTLTIDPSNATIGAALYGLSLYGQYWSGTEYFLVGTGVTFTVTDNYGPVSITNPVAYNLLFTSTYPNGSIFFHCSGAGPTLTPFTIPEGCSVGASIITAFRFPYNYSINPQLTFSIDRFAVPNSSAPLNLYKGNGNGCGCKATESQRVTTQSQRADPVTVGTGNLSEEVTDYTTAGPNSLSWTRFYNSQGNTGSLATTLGAKWRSNFDRHLRISSNQVIAERSDGQEVTFTFQNGLWITDGDVDLKLASSGSTWTLTDANDVIETYKALGSTSALLSSSQSRNGYTQTLTYNSSNQLTTITDSYSRSLILAYQNGLLKTVTTPDGTILTYGFAASGTVYLLTSVTYPTNPQTSQTYVYGNTAFPFALTEIVDEDGNQYETWAYDTLGRVVSNYAGTTATSANQVSFGYDNASGNVTVSNALGESESYLFTTLMGTAKIDEIDRQATSTTAAAKRIFTYDTNGYLASQTDWDGNQTNFVNDGHGQPTSIVEAASTPQARTTLITYDPTFVHLPKQIVRPGITTNFAYDGSGNVLTRTDTDTTAGTVPYPTNGQARTSTFTWNSYGLLATAQTARTDLTATTRYNFDSTFALSKITNPLGQSIQITSNTAGGRPKAVTDPNGVTTTLTYDSRQRLTSRAVQTSAGLLTTRFGYDPAGNLVTTTLPDGSSLTNTYDTAHRLTKVVDSLGNYTAYSLDGLGDRTQTSVYGSDGTLAWQGSGSFDALGRELVHTAGAGQTVTRSYDSSGNALTVADGLNHTTTNTYDALNRVSSSADANGGVTTPAYDTNDQVVSVTDANGNATAYVRDGFGEVIQQTSPDSGVSVFHYDADANLTSKTDALGIVTNQTFDAIDRRLTTTYPAHTAENVAYTYDQTGTGFSFGVGRMTSATDAAGSLRRVYDERGNLTSEVRTNGATTLATGYTYDGASRIASMTYPDGTLVGYQHNAAGYVSTVTAKLPGASSTTTLANLSHQPFGPINAVTYGNGVAETWTFDQAYRPTSIVDALSGTNLQSLAYGYDVADNVKTIADAVNPANTQAFGYDAVNRLTSAVSGAGGYGNFGWTYDKVGNRLSQQQGTTLTTYGYTPGTNRLLTISSGVEHAQAWPARVRKLENRALVLSSAMAHPAELHSAPVERVTGSVDASSAWRSGSFGWAMLFTGFAGVFSLRRRLRSYRLLAALSFASILTGSILLFSGCVSGASRIASSEPIALAVSVAGDVHGGQQPITGSSVQLYAVGTTGDRSAATPLLQTAVQTNSSGGFSIPVYTCPTANSLVYLVASGGNPGLATGTNNASIALMAALGTCSSLSSLPYVTVNEVTTVGSLAALYPYMSSPSNLGSGSSDAVELGEAFARVNEYTNIARGTVPGPTLPAGYYASSLEVQTLGDAIAACINSTGALTTGTACAKLYALTPSGSTAPGNTISALLNILNNPTQNVAGILGLVSAAAPFQPTLTSAPANWSLPIVTGPVAPVFSVPTGSYGIAETVILSTATTGATIYYTIDGSVPTTSSPKYTSALAVASTETVNAIAAFNVFATSTVASASYIISSSVAAITVTTNANGNITSIPPANSMAYATFSYNNANRLASVIGSPIAATFVYDWAGQRFSKTDGGTPPTLYSYSQDRAVIAENDGGAVTDYIYADGRPIAVIQPSATPAANQVSYVMADRLGTPQRLTSGSGATVWNTSYQPFGTTGAITASIEQNVRFPGQLANPETGFSYNLNRDYMPNLGRYLETDPVGLSAGPNTYSYVDNNSLSATDRNGLQQSSDLLQILQNRVSPQDIVDPGQVQHDITRLVDGPTFWETMDSKPQIITLSGSLIFVSGTIVIDQYGRIYLGDGGQLQTDWFGLSLTAGWLINGPITPGCLDSVVSGDSNNIGGGALLGGYISQSSNGGTIVNMGLITPGVFYDKTRLYRVTGP